MQWMRDRKGFRPPSRCESRDEPAAAVGIMAIVGVLFVITAAPLAGFIEWAAWRLGATVPLSTFAREQQGPDKALWLGAFKRLRSLQA